MLDIALINPPSPFLINQKAVPPLGLLYVASYLLKCGYSVELIDLANREPSDLHNDLPKARNYGITATTPQYAQALAIKNVIRLNAPKAKIFLGGHHASACSAACSKDGFDVAVQGEGERATELALNGLSYSHVSCPPVKDIDFFPLPARHLIDMLSYGYNFGHGPAPSMITSRGCSWKKCTFCASTLVFKEARFHSVRYVLQEVESLMNYGFHSIQFLDDAFTSNLGRLKKICEQLTPLGLKWRCYSRAGISRDTLEIMRNAGCVDIGFGAESGSQAILDQARKGTTVKDNTQFVRDCKDAGITVQAFIVVGLPGETSNTVQETLEWFERTAPDKFGLNMLVPVPGSPISEAPNKYGISIRNVEPERWAAKQHIPEAVCSAIATKDMSFSDIENAYSLMMKEFSQKTGFVPGVTHG